MITTQYMTSFTPEEMQLLIEQGKAKDARIAELEAQLAECRKLRTDYRMGVDPIEYNDLYYRAEGEIDSLRAQLAAAMERERGLRENLRHFAEPVNWDYSVKLDQAIWIGATNPMELAQAALAAQQEGK